MITIDLQRNVGRKKKRPYEPSESQPRNFPACSNPENFSSSCPSPNIMRFAVAMNLKSEKAAAKVIIDLTETDGVGACGSVRACRSHSRRVGGVGVRTVQFNSTVRVFWRRKRVYEGTAP